MHHMQHTLAGCGYIHLHALTSCTTLHHFQLHTLAPYPTCMSTSTTYRAGILKYYTFCFTLGINPLPGTNHSINLFAAYLSQTLQANTIQVYMAGISHLHLTHGFSSPVHNNPTLNLAIRGIQRSQGPAHLRPKRLPLTIGMLEQLLRLLEADPLSRHDKLMLKAALTFGFFGFLRVSEYTLTNRGRFDPTLHPTKNDITWVKDGMHFLIKTVQDRSSWERYYHCHGPHPPCIMPSCCTASLL